MSLKTIITENSFHQKQAKSNPELLFVLSCRRVSAGVVLLKTILLQKFFNEKVNFQGYLTNKEA